MSEVRVLRLAVFGDSIAQGLGLKHDRYPELICDALDAQLVDYSASGSTVADSLLAYRANPQMVDLAVIAHGVTEPIWRPTPRALRYFPARWQRRGWMDPRAYYSRRLRRRLLEKIESAMRWRLKNVVMKLPHGKEQLLSQRDYVATMREFCGELRAAGAQVIVLGPPPIDDRYFPGSRAEQRRYFEALDVPDVTTLDLLGVLDEWSDFFLDHFHPNHQGHRKIADVILEVVHAKDLP